MNGVSVVNFSAPELNYLAAALSNAGLLQAYLRPYVNKGRPWECVLERIPVTRRFYGRTLGRRRLPPGLEPSLVHEVALLTDFMAAGTSRLNSLGFSIGDKISGSLQYRVQIKLGKSGGWLAIGSSAVVASYLVALPAFRGCAGPRILNYPVAHHRYIKRFVAEESEREPDFASMLPDWNSVPAWVEPRLDSEVQLADRILVGSTFARSTFIAESVLAERLRVVPYGVDLSLFRPDTAVPLDGSGFHVLFVGQVGQRKGISYLLKAYDRFHGRGSTLTLVGNIQGTGGPLRRYRKLFRHIPNVPQSRLAEIYRQADVFVFPTLIEGLGLVVLEAMASGLPVIVTPNGPGDIVRDGIDGFVVPPRDVDAIVDRLEYLRTNPDVRSEMGRNARERSSSFSWGTYQNRVMEALNEILGQVPT